MLIISLNAQVFSQEGSVWAFEFFSGLDFNYEPPKVIHSKIQTNGSCATICDKKGKLKYYSDGITIYDGNHEVVNKDDSLRGILETTQGSIFVKHPLSNILYLFTIESPTYCFVTGRKGIPGLYYHELNYYTGKMIKWNIPIGLDSFRYINAVKHANDTDIWVVSFKYPDTFYSILMTKNGIGKIVKSTFSIKLNKDYYYNRGSIKFSHDGKQMIQCYSGNNEKYNKDVSYIILYDFDKTNGVITNKKIIDEYIGSMGLSDHYYFDAAFSPNDSFFYVTDAGSDRTYVLQYERFAKNIVDSKYEVKELNLTQAMQLAPNGKIYVSYVNMNGIKEYVSEITKPNKKGSACEPKVKTMKVANIVNVTAFPNAFYQYLRINFKVNNYCRDSLNFINQSDSSIFKKFTWYFLPSDSSNSFHAKHSFEKSGKYFVKLKGVTDSGYIQWYSDSVTFIKKPIAQFSIDSNIGCQYVAIKFHNQTISDTFDKKTGESWFWDFGDNTFDTIKNPSHTYYNTGDYQIKLYYSNGFCSDSFVLPLKIKIIEAPKPGFSVNDSNHCTPFELNIMDKSKGKVSKYLYSFGDGETDTNCAPNHLYNTKGTYWVKQTLTGPTGCVTKDSIRLYLKGGYNKNDKVRVVTTNVLDGHSIEIKWKNDGFAEYYKIFRNSMFLSNSYSHIFVDNKVDPNNLIYDYQIIGIDSCGKRSDTSIVMNNLLIQGINSNNDFSELFWNKIKFWDKGVGSYQVESLNIDEYLTICSLKNNSYQDFDFVNTDFSDYGRYYRIKATEKDSNIECTSNVIFVEYNPVVYIPNSFTPNNDGINDSFWFACLNIKLSFVEIFDRWGQKVFDSGDAHTSFWDGTYQENPLPEGVYFYRILAASNSNKTYTFKGSITLLR